MYHPYLTEPIFIELFRNEKNEEGKAQIPHFSACAEAECDYFLTTSAITFVCIAPTTFSCSS